jgi:alpha-maltose-1-phosphate synthase
MSVRVCHPFGNPNSYNAAIALLEVNYLERFHTTLYQPFGIQKRCHAELPREWVSTHPAREVLRLAATTLPLGPWNGRQQHFVDWVTTGFDQKIANSLGTGEGAVYCYEDSALATFHRGREEGVVRIYELPTPYHREKRRLFEKEAEREPEVGRFLVSPEPTAKLRRKDAELLAADVIVVPSRFVQESIEKFLRPSGKFLVVPYGSDTNIKQKGWTAKDDRLPLRLFFAGALGPGKGLHLLFSALSHLPRSHFHLSLAGRWKPGFQEWLSKEYSVSYDWLGQLTQAEVYETCRQSDIFVFPSLADGFGLVILEAMASGIPVIATDQTAGPEIIESGVDGWIVPAGDVVALRNTIEGAMQTRTQLAEMGIAARHKSLTWSWSSYRRRLRMQLIETLGESVLERCA